ncbi:MAG: hypothetical protein AAF741_15965 [Bacteroidota bacterium]
MTRKGRIGAIFFCSASSVLMLFLCFLWLSMPRTFGDEAFLIKWTSLVKKTVLGLDEKPAPEDFLYIDVSRSKRLVEEIDPLFEFYTGFNHTAITDREQIADLLGAIATYGDSIPLVIMDVNFRDTSVHDSFLRAALDSFPFPIALASTLSAEKDTIAPVFNKPSGVAMYMSVDNTFMKYPLYYEKQYPSLPLVGYQLSQKLPTNSSGWWVRLNDKLSLSNPIIDFKIRPFDLSGTGRYHIHEMGSLLFQFTFWEESDIELLFSGKTIIIGDFYNDTHDTVFGQMPGPVIVHNAYLSLVENETLVQTEWIVFLILLFFWLSWRIYNEERLGSRSWLWQRSQTALGKLVADSIDDTFFLILGTIISYLFFNIHINILVLLIYLKIMAYLLRKFWFRGGKAKSAST